MFSKRYYRKKLLIFTALMILTFGLEGCGKEVDDTAKKGIAVTQGNETAENPDLGTDTSEEVQPEEEPETDSVENPEEAGESDHLIEYNMLEEGYIQSGNLIYYILKDGKTAEVSIDDSEDAEIEIPAEVTDEETGKKYKVVGIGESCFAAHEELVHVKMPDSLTYIKKEAFANCILLESAEIPDSVTKIGEGTYFGCEAMKSIKLPASLKKISDEVFTNCMALQSVEIPASVTEIGREAFWYCTSLTELLIPEGVEKIDSRAFYNCEQVKKVVFPSSLKEVPKDVFEYCEGLEELQVSPGQEEQYKVLFSKEAFRISTQ